MTKKKHLPHSWMPLLAIAVFSLGMVGGLLRSADAVAEDFSYTVVPHAPGRVAGATVTVSPGPISLVVNDGKGERVYVVDLTEPTSVFSVLRLALRRTVLKIEMLENTDHSLTLQSVDGVSATNAHTWRIRQNGNLVDSVNTPTLVPGDTLLLELVSF